MLTKSRYFIKGLCFSFVLLTSVVISAQEMNDSSFKKKVAVIEKPVQHLVRLEPALFEYDQQASKTGKLTKGKYYGFTIEDIEAVFPELVKHTTQTYMFGKNTYRTRIVKTVNMESLIPILVASVKEQQIQIEQLRQEVQALKNRPVASVN
jgi:uncharacterized protein YyaL (SSP411 family)